MADHTSSLDELPGQDLEQTVGQSSNSTPQEPLENAPLSAPSPSPIYDEATGLEDISAPSPSPIESIGNDAQAPQSASTPESSPGALRALSSQTRSGYSAMKEVQQAKRDHANAKERLAKLQAEIDADNKTLEHRRQIERDYDAIVHEQSGLIEQANASLKQLNNEVSTLNNEVRSLQNELNQLKQTHAKDLAPYKDLADAAKDRADADQKNLAAARRAARSADKHVKDLTRRRDDSIDQANKAIQAAAAQLSRLTNRAQELQADPNANATELKKISQEIEAQKKQRQRSQSEVKEIPLKAQSSIQAAQDGLAQAITQLESAKKNAEVSKQASASKAQEYRQLKSSYKQEEDAIAANITNAQKQLRSANAKIASEEKDKKAAQSVIDEAEAIHSTPQETQNLANKVADNSAAAEVQQQQVDALAQNEQAVRERTKQSRRRFIAIIILAVIVAMVIIGLVYFFMGQGG